MDFTISRESLLRPLQMAVGAVERRQTLPILSNLLLDLDGDSLSITGTDMEVELTVRVGVDKARASGRTTASAHKMLDLCRSLDEGADVAVKQQGSSLRVGSGKRHGMVATLPADDFPIVGEVPDAFSLTLPREELRALLGRTSFAMAEQEVRYYLNGMLFELAKDYFRVVATDAHRLAMETLEVKNDVKETQQVILPRKGVTELARLLADGQGDIRLVFGDNHVRAISTFSEGVEADTGQTATSGVPDFTFTSKLVDGKYPDYQRVIPKGGDRVVVGDRTEMRRAFAFADILAHEKYHGGRLALSKGLMKVHASNAEQEEAKEEVKIKYKGEEMEIGFNIRYLIDVLDAMGSKKARMTLSGSDSSALLEEEDGGDAVYVVMSMRL